MKYVWMKKIKDKYKIIEIHLVEKENKKIKKKR